MNQLILTMFLFFVFVSLSLIVFYPIGYLVISQANDKLSDVEKITFSYLISIIFFVLMALFLSILNLRVLHLPILIIFFTVALIRNRQKLLEPFRILIQDKYLLILIIVGIIVQGFINLPSGYLYKDGLLFWSSQGHDGIWHVALMEEVKKTMPLANPLMAGEQLYNYHYLIDVVMGEFGRIFPFFSSLDLYFRFFPVLLSFLISISVFAFVNRWKENKTTAYFALSFTWLIGSFGYVVKYLRQGTIWGGETVFWASQGNTILGNPPHASAFALIPAIFLAFLLFIRKRSKYWFIITFILTFMLSGFKVSAGLTVLGGLVFAVFVDFILTRKFDAVALIFGLGITNFITMKLMTREATSLLIFKPWWFVRTMIVVGDRLNWIDLELRRQHYASLGTFKAKLRLIEMESIALFLFIVGNLGMKFIGLLEIFKRLLKLKLKIFQNPLDLVLMASAFISVMMVLLFVQKGITYNHIQYFQYFALIVGWYAAISIDIIISRLKKYYLKLVVIVIFIILSTPTVIGNLVEFYGPEGHPLAYISNEMLDGLEYLKNNSEANSVILTVPFQKDLYSKYDQLPFPIYAWYSTSYIPAIASRRTFLSSEEQLDIMGYNWRERRSNAEKYFFEDDLEWSRDFLKDENISYIFIANDELNSSFDWKTMGLEEWFYNSEVSIFKVI